MRLFSHAEGELKGPPRWLWADSAHLPHAQRLKAMVAAPLREVEQASLALANGGWKSAT